MAWARVNTAVGAAGSGTTLTAAATNHTAGNLLVVGVSFEGAVTLSSLQDTAGNSYTLLTQAGTTNPACTIGYAFNITGNASNVVQANFSGSADYTNMIVLQYSGGLTTDPIDDSAQGADNSSGGTVYSTASFDTTVDQGLLVAFGAAFTSITSTPGGSWVEVIDSVGNVLFADEQLGVSIGSYTGSATVDNASTWAMSAASFKIAGGAPPPSEPLIQPDGRRLRPAIFSPGMAK